MRRDEIIELMARAMHDHEYTTAYEDLREPTRQNLRGLADAVLEALEEAGEWQPA